MNKELHQLDADELEMLAGLIETDISAMYALLFPDRRSGYETIVKEIGQWAINRKIVLDHRTQRNPHVALVFDKVCYRIWQKLPGYAKSLRVEADTLAGMVLVARGSQ